MKSKVVLPKVGLINFVIEITMVPNTKYVRILLGRGIRDETQGITSGWKWWQTVLETKMSCNRWEGSTWAQEKKWWQTVLKTKMSCNRWEGSTWAQEKKWWQTVLKTKM